MDIASFFSGAGGLDLGFTNAGFNLVYANDNWEGCWETFEKNHGIKIDRRSIADVRPEDIPDVAGFVGGPPCQSWSLAGKMEGIDDPRGKIFWAYVDLIEAKKPLFFLAENVPGIISKTHIKEFEKLISRFRQIGYRVSYKPLDARDYGVPQDRRRVIAVGYRNDLGIAFEFPPPTHSKDPKISLDGRTLKPWVTLRETIGDLPEAKPAREKNKANGGLDIPNHEYMNGGFSTIYMSRNRVRGWDEQSFTIQAGGRHAPCHPKAPKMEFVEKDKRIFAPGKEHLYRRLSVRECARIQTFPDDFIFYYDNVADGYKMVGNAVPVKLAEALARKIMQDLRDIGEGNGRQV